MTHKTLSTHSSPPEPAPPAPRLRVGKVCVAIQASSPSELIERAEAALLDAKSDAKFLEFRLDALPDPAAALAPVKAFLAEHRDVVVLAT
jgi:3-dehydroquinate dehydratase/shikimate dehydrogenase